MSKDSCSLRELQSSMLNAILTGDDSQVKEHVKGPRDKSAESSLSIYRSLVAGNHYQALQTVYPICIELVGEDFFEMLTWKFIQAQPPKDFNLDNYGDGLATFLKANLNSIVPENLYYLHEMAEFEWALYQAASKKFLVDFNFEEFAQLSESDQLRVKFNLQAGLSLLSFENSISRLWEYHKNTYSTSFDLGVKQQLIVWWSGVEVKFAELSAETYQLLKSIAEGRQLLELPFQESLPALFQKQWVASYELC